MRAVLLVEDQRVLALEFAESLRDAGAKDVLVAHTLEEAEAHRAMALPDAALLDINLGGGETTLALGRALADAGLRVVFMSGYPREDYGADLQGFEFLEKPIGFQTLRSAFQT